MAKDFSISLDILKEIHSFLDSVMMDKYVPRDTSEKAFDLWRSIFGGKNPEDIEMEANINLKKVYYTSNEYTEIPIAKYDIINNLVGQGQKIPAIKELRLITSLGLKEAKDCVEYPRNWTDMPPPF